MVPISQRQRRQRQRQQTTQPQTKTNDEDKRRRQRRRRLASTSIHTCPVLRLTNLPSLFGGSSINHSSTCSSTRRRCSRQGRSRPRSPPPPGVQTRQPTVVESASVDDDVGRQHRGTFGRTATEESVVLLQCASDIVGCPLPTNQYWGGGGGGVPRFSSDALRMCGAASNALTTVLLQRAGGRTTRRRRRWEEEGVALNGGDFPGSFSEDEYKYDERKADALLHGLGYRLRSTLAFGYPCAASPPSTPLGRRRARSRCAGDRRCRHRRRRRRAAPLEEDSCAPPSSTARCPRRHSVHCDARSARRRGMVGVLPSPAGE